MNTPPVTSQAHPAFFAAIQATLAHCIQFLTGRGAALWNQMEPVIASEAGAVLEALLPFAEQVVLSLATSGKSGSEKKAAAFDQLKEAAEANTIKAANNLLNKAIEDAVANLTATGKIQ